MRRFLVLAVAVAALVAASPALAKTYDEGTILPGRGATVGPDAIPVLIGMKKAKVLKSLGKPVYQNAFGYLQYSKKNLFDVFVNTGNGNRVDVLSFSGPEFCLPFDVCLLQNGGVKALRQKFGGALKRDVLESGETVLVVRTRVDGQKRVTTFRVSGQKPGSQIVQVDVDAST